MKNMIADKNKKKNITLSEDLREDKKMVKNSQNQSHLRKV